MIKCYYLGACLFSSAITTWLFSTRWIDCSACETNLAHILAYILSLLLILSEELLSELVFSAFFESLWKRIFIKSIFKNKKNKKLKLKNVCYDYKWGLLQLITKKPYYLYHRNTSRVFRPLPTLFGLQNVHGFSLKLNSTSLSGKLVNHSNLVLCPVLNGFVLAL